MSGDPLQVMLSRYAELCDSLHPSQRQDLGWAGDRLLSAAVGLAMTPAFRAAEMSRVACFVLSNETFSRYVGTGAKKPGAVWRAATRFEVSAYFLYKDYGMAALLEVVRELIRQNPLPAIIKEIPVYEKQSPFRPLNLPPCDFPKSDNG